MAEDDTEQIISDEQTLIILKVLMMGVTPVISVLGVIGNTFSIIILTKHGFRKCSNIMLMFLAINDLLYLIGFNNIPKILYELVDYAHGFNYSRSVGYSLFIIHNICILIDHASCAMSLTLPVLITLERLAAVFLPLKFHRIFTPVRTWCVVIGLQIVWYTLYIYIVTDFYYYSYQYDPNYNISVGNILRSESFYANLAAVAIIEEAIIYAAMKFPPIIVFVGCVAIGIKVHLASRQRKKMTSSSGKEGSSNRTTKMLLAVCAIYTVACTITSLPTLIPNLSYAIFDETSTNIGLIMYQVLNLTLGINSSCNFVIYVVMNKNFRDTYKSLFVGCCSKQRKENYIGKRNDQKEMESKMK